MFSARLYIRILLQVVAIVLVAGLGVAGIVTGRAVILGFVALFIAAWLISLLVYYLNASNRRIQLFLDAIEDDESMLCFPEDIGSREQRRLHAAFNRIHMLMTENRRKAFDRELHCKEYESWDKLMHVLTHEIMNSIAPVVSLSGTLLSYFRTKDAPKSSGEITDATIRKTIRGLDTIKSQGQTLMHFTESYRQFAYLKQPEPEPFPLTYLLQNLQTLYLPDMQRQHIDFSLVLFQPEITVHADEKLLYLSGTDKLWDKVIAMTGIRHRSPTARQRQMVADWGRDFSEDMLQLACDIMKENADKPSLKYMDSVLRRWKKEGLTTPAQVQEQQQSFTAAKAKKADGRLQGKPSYDLEQIKRDTMNNTDIKF